MLVLEIGIKLDKDLDYYDKVLKEHGLINDYKVKTHDMYYTNKSLDNLTERQMKDACIRLRSCNNGKYQIQNNMINNLNELSKWKLRFFERKLSKEGFYKIFDTTKYDYHYFKEGMNSKVQLQQINGMGLLVYFDNSNYYDLELNEQRKKLIDELNSYGFKIDYNTLGLDKLRTLYYHKKMYSDNQNG